MFKLLVKFPSRNRPEKFKSILNRYVEWLSGKHSVRFIITMDEDDSTMNVDEIKEYLDSHIKNGVDLSYYYGNSKTKVEACNANVIMLISDDMVLQQKNYDDLIFENFQVALPEYDGGIKFFDGLRPDILMTLPVIGWKFYEKFGYIYNPKYTSLYCDTEQTEVLYKLGKLAVNNICLAKHEWTAEPFDELHARNENLEMYEKDGIIYQHYTLLIKYYIQTMIWFFM